MAGTGRTGGARQASVHRVEALPGAGRWAVTFRRPDAGEQTAVVELVDTGARVAETSLPTGWTGDDPAFVAIVEALAALTRSRAAAEPAGRTLRDVDGGWDVGLGNVVLDASGGPTCTAHGPLRPEPTAANAGSWICDECGARALLG